MRDYPYLGPIIVIVSYIIATILFLPGLILTLGTGFAFTAAYKYLWSKPPNVFDLVSVSIPLGSVCVWIGAEIGAFCAFLLGRYIVRKPIQHKIDRVKIFSAIDRVIA